MTILGLLFLVACSIQILYYLIFNIGALKFKQSGESTESVSVIIAAHNEHHNLTHLLGLLLEQNHPDFEIIVADDRSSDDSHDFLLEMAAKHKNLKYVRIDQAPNHVQGKKYAIMLGVKAAANDLMVFTDADCEPISKDWLTKMASAASNKKIVLGFSQYKKLDGFLNYFIRFETLMTGIQYLSLARLGFPYMGVGRNLSYRKSLYDSVKGFNGYQSVIGGDDDLFVNKNATAGNTAVCIDPGAVMLSNPKTTWGDFFRQKKRHLSVGKHYTLGTQIILSIFSLTLILTWLLLPAALLFEPNIGIIGGLIFARTLLQIMVFSMATKQLGKSINLWGILILDIVYVFYYLSTGMAAFFTKQVKWS